MEKFSFRAYFDDAINKDDNICGVFTRTDPLTDEEIVVVLVKDDQPKKLKLYRSAIGEAASRGFAQSVVFEKSPGFTAPPPSEDVAFPKDVDAYADPTDRHRPAPSGVSIGHVRITAGTMGGVVRDKATGMWLILSNNHILANENNANVGDTILQPGVADSGKNPDDKIATTLRWIQLNTSDNYADAAVAKVINPDDVSLEHMNLGHITGVAKYYVNQEVVKSGRTTRTTRGPILGTATVKVGYGGGRTRTFKNCLISTVGSAGGDSGSAILDMFTRRYIGILFAGDGYYTIINPQEYIFGPLGIETIKPPYPLFGGAYDVSHWNPLEESEDFDPKTATKSNLVGLTLENFQEIKDMGYDLIIAKLGQPGVGVDSAWEDIYANCRKVGLKVGGYVFCDPAYSAEAHRDILTQAMAGGKTLDQPPAMDCEKASGKSKAQITAVYKGVSQYFEAWYQKGLPYIYTSLSFWLENVDPWTINSTDHWGDHPCWSAWWSRSAYFGKVPYSWEKTKVMPDIWQIGPYPTFLKDNAGKVIILDCNVINPGGYALLNGGAPPPPPNKVTLTVTINGSGFVSPSSGQYDKDSTVQLQATPENGWQFAFWSGDYTGSANPLTVVMSTDKSVIANFTQDGGEPQPAKFTHYKARVISKDGLNIRRDPSTAKAPWFAVQAGTILEILDTKQVGTDLWVRVGKDQWAAYRYKGTELLALIMESEQALKNAAG